MRYHSQIGDGMASESNSDRLVRKIAELNVTRLEVAEFLGVSERSLYRWMTGQHAFPRMVLIALELMETRQ